MPSALPLLTDPRVEAVADALGGPMVWTPWPAALDIAVHLGPPPPTRPSEHSIAALVDALRIAAVAVAALDAYDLDRETSEGGRKAAAVARAVLAERERIAESLAGHGCTDAAELVRRGESDG